MRQSVPLWEVTRRLTATARGLEPADLIVKNGRLVNVFTGEILEHTDIAVRCGRIALVGNASHIPCGRIVDAAGRYLTPGFIDAHLHVESSMTTVCEYARCTVPHGTSAIFMDPHEIVNVLGLSGMRAMLEDGRQSLLRVYATTPSCVPATPGLESTGGTVGPEDVAESMAWENVAGLGEMMDFSGILGGSRAHDVVAATLRAGKPVTGHFPLDDTGAVLNAYAAAGISSCHESTTAEQALAKMRLGMVAMIREGSAWHDLPQVIRAVTEHSVDTRLAVLVSDDLHADTLLHSGHMDHIVRLAITCGVPPVTAVQMATLNAASCFGLGAELGSLAPGRLADINILSSLREVTVEQVILGGEAVAQDGKLTVPAGSYAYPDSFLHTVHAKPRTPEDFRVRTAASGSVRVNVMEVGSGSVLTTRRIEELPVTDGCIQAAPERDIIKAAVIDRHHPEGGMSVAFVKGFGLKEGAAASTYAHDAHNLLVIGADDRELAFAANTLIGCGGGMTAVRAGEVLSLLKLPVAGLMSDRPAPEVAASLRSLDAAWKLLGSPLVSPFMTMSLLSLAVIPELRITDRGLVDVMKNQLTPLEAAE